MDLDNFKIALCGIAKNEFDYIEEWVAYHKIVGFDDVFIYDNISQDGTSELLINLAEIGEIKRIHWPRKEGIPPQRHAYNDFLEFYARNYDYVLICDVDEFFYSDLGNVKEFIKTADKAELEIGAIAIPWLMFGPNGKQIKEPGLVLERFTATRAQPSSEVKSLFNPSKAFNMRTHICDLISGHYLDNNFEVAQWGDKRPIDLANPTFGKAVICHFYTKSKEEWLKRRSGVKADRAHAEYRDLNEFSKFMDATTPNDYFQSICSLVKQKIDFFRQEILKLSCQVTEFNLYRFDSSWVMASIKFNKPIDSLSLHVVLNDDQEYRIQTICSGSEHVIALRVKWKVPKLWSLKVLIPQAQYSEVFERGIKVPPITTLRFMLDYMPSAEETIFEFFLKSLVQQQNFIELKKLNYPLFEKFTDQGQVLKLALTCLSDIGFDSYYFRNQFANMNLGKKKPHRY